MTEQAILARINIQESDNGWYKSMMYEVLNVLSDHLGLDRILVLRVIAGLNRKRSCLQQT